MRRLIEGVLRIAGVAALLMALLFSMQSPQLAHRGPVALPAAALVDSSARALVDEISQQIVLAAADSAWPQLQFDATRIPGGAVRSVLGVARAAGMPVAWSDHTRAAGLAVSATPAVDPAGGTIVRASGSRREALVVRDAASVLDSVGSAADGVTIRAARLSSWVEARQGDTRATVAVPEPAVLRRVRLVASPGWEAKFVAAALEERGWLLDASWVVARRAAIATGVPSNADTSRYAAVVVLDSGVADSARLRQYVRQGGGVVLSGDALRDGALADLRPATVSGLRPAVPGALLTDAPREGMVAYVLRPEAHAVVLRDDAPAPWRTPAVVAWRVGAGRVLASAYRETWHWRMEGTDAGVDQHRSWWSEMVSAVAFVPTLVALSRADSLRSAAETSRLPGNAAPYADLVARLGAPVSRLPSPGELSPSTTPRLWLLYLLATLALLTEWASRRLRGAR